MRFRHRQHSVPQLNTTSTADISFMLLIFFLVTTNMDVDKGLARQLPPPERQERQESVVDKGTMLELTLTADNRLLADGRPMPVSRLRARVEAFVTQVGPRHLIKVQADPAASYDAYFQVQNALAAAYGRLRNAEARRLYGRDYAKLSPQQRDHVRDLCPQRIAEPYDNSAAEPVSAPAAAGKGGRP